MHGKKYMMTARNVLLLFCFFLFGFLSLSHGQSAELSAYKNIKYSNSLDDIENFFLEYPGSQYTNDVCIILVNNVTSIESCKKYSLKYPSLKNALKVKAFDIAYAGDYDSKQAYLDYFPDGEGVPHFKKEIRNNNIEIENEKIRKKNEEHLKALEEQRIKREEEAKLKLNSDPKSWKLGDRICSREMSIEGAIEDWNENNTSVKIKIVGGDKGTNYKGELITKNAFIWVSTSDWYKCTGDENIDYNLPTQNEYNKPVQKEQTKKEKYATRMNGQLARRFALGLGKQIMYNKHVEDSPRNINVNIKEWEILDGTDLSYAIHVDLTWLENPFFTMKRTVTGTMLIDEYGCGPVMVIETHNLPSLFFPVFSTIDSEAKEVFGNRFGKEYKYQYTGQCVE